MTLYLCLVSALILSVVDSQTANVTEDQTSTTANRTVTIRNVTSILSEEERTQIEGELENNQRSAVITEDDENFQDQEAEFPFRRCDREHLVNFSHSLCGEVFHKEMLSIDEENWCVLDSVISPYNRLTLCLEKLSDWMGCFYPNPDIQAFFLEIHTLYFQNCSSKELPLADAPDGLVIALTLIPVSLIPVLVHLVVCKSKVRE